MDESTIACFKGLAQVERSLQTLINLYLRDCAASHKRLAPKMATGGIAPANQAL